MRINLLLAERKAPACKQPHLRRPSSVYMLQLHEIYMYRIPWTTYVVVRMFLD